jgi:hypothetical protein
MMYSSFSHLEASSSQYRVHYYGVYCNLFMIKINPVLHYDIQLMSSLLQLFVASSDATSDTMFRLEGGFFMSFAVAWVLFFVPTIFCLQCHFRICAGRIKSSRRTIEGRKRKNRPTDPSTSLATHPFFRLIRQQQNKTKRSCEP